ncbi:DUF7556 family protein [Halobellus ruber]|uniref:Uncharacterized protein n=1 Tax=Halobellus ruber TaxID=2761102 RepID=A0A7J9SLS0_9EURY|nr:hypothetical protein [Halobellus ruber]MBB6647323.1 hypothetical protein [Halobellus ruber]
MTQNATAVTDASNTEVMASVDSASAQPEFVIADVSRDDAWLSVPVAEAPSLREWI